MKTKQKKIKEKPINELQAIKRVLLLVKGCLSAMNQDLLIAYNGGMMTVKELQNNVKASLTLKTMKNINAEG